MGGDTQSIVTDAIMEYIKKVIAMLDTGNYGDVSVFRFKTKTGKKYKCIIEREAG